MLWSENNNETIFGLVLLISVEYMSVALNGIISSGAK
jgi:hypothetical protein